MNLVVIFRTHSDVEASIVRGLLEANGVMSIVSSAVPHSVFPLTVDGLGEVRISVREDEAEEATRIIESHRIGDPPNGKVVRIRDEFDELEQAIDYRFRDRGLLEHAMTHTSRANEDISGGVEQARAFIVREFAALVNEVRRSGVAGGDHKSALQEYLQSHDEALPEYRLAGTVGPDHQKLFQIQVIVREQVVGEAIAPSKKEAEQEAAKAALEKLKDGN
jgi:hypothetical protein